MTGTVAGYWVPMPECHVVHPYGEEGWRPSGTYGIHEHWIPALDHDHPITYTDSVTEMPCGASRSATDYLCTRPKGHTGPHETILGGCRLTAWSGEHASSVLMDMAREIHEVNKSHGWYDQRRSFGDMIALLHSEISEMLEAYRDHGFEDVTSPALQQESEEPNLPKPEGVGSEAADVLIRLLDLCVGYAIDLDYEYRRKFQFNKSREYRHGGKRL